MKKSSLTVLLIILIFMICGCSNNKVISNGKKVNTSKMSHKHCIRSGSGNGITANLSYELYYTDDILNILESTEQVVSSNSSDLDEYENAYNKINSYYTGLKYYDTNVERTDSTVTRTATINYDKIDINQLLEIEGEGDNIIENGKAKINLWLNLAKKFGTKCEDVED